MRSLAKSLLQSLYQRAEPITSRKEDYLKAADLLAKARLPVAARAVRQEMYEELLRQDPLVNAHSVGLAEVHLESKQPARAVAVLERMRHSGANEEGHRLAAQLLWKYRSTKLDAASPVTLGDKAKEVWRDLLKINPLCHRRPTATGRGAWQAGSGGEPGAVEIGPRIAGQHLRTAGGGCTDCGKDRSAGTELSSAELRFIAALESWRSVPKPTTPAPPLPALPAAYYAPIYAAGATAAGLPCLLWTACDGLSILIRPVGSKGCDGLAAVCRFDPRLRSGEAPGIAGGPFRAARRRVWAAAVSVHRHASRQRDTESGNPLEGPDAEEVTGPPPLTAISASAAEKVALMKLVIAAYSSLQADDLAAQQARNSAALLASSRQAFLAQARQLEEKARQSAEALAARFSVNDTLGEELSRRKPVSRPRRERVRS